MMFVVPQNTQAHWVCLDNRTFIPYHLMKQPNGIRHKFVIFRHEPLAYEGVFGLVLFTHSKNLDDTRKRYIREMTNAMWRGFSKRAVLCPSEADYKAFMMRVLGDLVEREVSHALTA